VALTGDGPFDVLQTISFNDSAQRPIVGPFSGYDLMIVNKYGGYQFNGDPRASAVYSVVTGTGATGGSFNFVLYVPLEVDQRDGMGALLNKNESSQFQLTMTVNTESGVYTTSPTAAPSVNVSVVEDGWWSPKAADNDGNQLSSQPPLKGATQYWSKSQIGSSGISGSIQQQLNGGLGFAIRNIVFESYDNSNSTRATGQTDFPDPCQLIYKGSTLWNVPKWFWQDRMSRLFGYMQFAGSTYAADGANSLENGIFALPFNWDSELTPGNELRWGYLETQQGDSFQMFGTVSAAANLYELVNYVASPTTQSALRVGR
jgi:hypothetical protein